MKKLIALLCACLLLFTLSVCAEEAPYVLTVRSGSSEYIDAASLSAAPEGYVFANSYTLTDPKLFCHTFTAEDASAAVRTLSFQCAVKDAKEMPDFTITNLTGIMTVFAQDEVIETEINGHAAYIIAFDYLNSFQAEKPYTQSANVYIDCGVEGGCLSVSAINTYATEEEMSDRAPIVEAAIAACEAIVHAK